MISTSVIDGKVTHCLNSFDKLTLFKLHCYCGQCHCQPEEKWLDGVETCGRIRKLELFSLSSYVTNAQIVDISSTMVN